MKLTFKPVAAAMALLLVSVAVQAAGPYNPVTDARLQNPEPRNWLSTRGNYQGWGYSPLEKINTANVGKLQQAWSFSTGVQEGHQAPPIVNDGYMSVVSGLMNAQRLASQ